MLHSINCFRLIFFAILNVHVPFRNWLDHACIYACILKPLRSGWPALRLKLPLQSMTALDRFTVRGCSSNLLRGSGLLGRVFGF